MDDTLVFGKSLKEHDEHLKETLCKFSSVGFLGTIVNAEGIQVDPKKVEAITEMAAPKDPSELRWFLGMVDQLSKFQPQIANTRLIYNIIDKLNSNDQEGLLLLSDFEKSIRFGRMKLS